MITEDYVSLETAKLLKEKGFNEKVYGYYSVKSDNDDTPQFSSLYNHNQSIQMISAPTLQMAMKWLREEKGIAVIPVISSVLDYEKFLWHVNIVVAKTNNTYSQGWVYEKQEDACEAAIKYCLENLI